jgi:hypothetical protein
MPLTASALDRLSLRFKKKSLFDVSDCLAISATCARRGDIFGRETWIDSAIERMQRHGISVPASIYTAYLSDLAA